MIPLLWCWWLGSAATAVIWSTGATAHSPTSGRITCEEAHKKCSFREDCTKNLLNYMKDCADVLHGLTTRCPYACRRTLIALMSHEAGLELAMCDCRGEPFCQTHKERLEVCRPEVSYATADNTVVSCSIAELICSADYQCQTALTYYHRLCKSMFHGHKCTRRCNNSLDILSRQEKASKLHDCYCDGSEDFPCIRIKQNTQRLCLGKETYREETHHMFTTTPESTSGCRTFKPSWCWTWFVTSIVILWTLSNSNENCYSTMRSCQTLKAKHEHSISDRLSVKSLHLTVWPWWWTSENTKV